jgi:hypothetical protein
MVDLPDKKQVSYRKKNPSFWGIMHRTTLPDLEMDERLDCMISAASGKDIETPWDASTSYHDMPNLPEIKSVTADGRQLSNYEVHLRHERRAALLREKEYDLLRKQVGTVGDSIERLEAYLTYAKSRGFSKVHISAQLKLMNFDD